MPNNFLTKMCSFAGWLGMVVIHGATMPVTVRAIIDSNVSLPPLDMVLMMWTGLFLYLIRAIAQKDFMYIVSNGVGVFMQSTLLFIYWLH